MGTLKILWTQLFNMYKLVIASILAVASSLPIEDTADVAAAKAEFLAAFADAEAGGLAAKQAPAPVHEIPAPAPLAAPVAAPALPYAAYPYGINALNVLGAYPGYGYAAGLPYAAYTYAGLPVIAAPAAKA